MPILKIRGLTPAVCKFTSSMVVDATFPMCSLFIFWDVSTNIWLIIFMTVYLVVFVDSSEHLCRTGKKLRYMLHSQAGNWAHLLFVIFSLPSYFWSPKESAAERKRLFFTLHQQRWKSLEIQHLLQVQNEKCVFILGVGQTKETLSQSMIHYLEKR